MTRARIDLGRRAEDAAEAYLRRRRYRIVERNFRCAVGEIDLVSAVGDTIVFVEVRSRHGSAFGTGVESVDLRKQRRIARAAEIFLLQRGLSDVAVRFDVLGVEWRDGEPCIDHIEDAFDAPA